MTGPTTEQKNEPNHDLYEHWQQVFRKIDGFDKCLCLRRVRCPDRNRDMDFLLVQPGPAPKLGLVECEGFKGRNNKDKHTAPEGTQQLISYLAGFIEFTGDGRRIFDICIDNAFDIHLNRGKHNVKKWGSVDAWIQKLNVVSKSALVDLLSRASRTLIPVLLYYRKQPISEKERKALSLAFKHHALYVGAVRWPEANALLDGGYV